MTKLRKPPAPAGALRGLSVCPTGETDWTRHLANHTHAWCNPEAVEFNKREAVSWWRKRGVPMRLQHEFIWLDAAIELDMAGVLVSLDALSDSRSQARGIRPGSSARMLGGASGGHVSHFQLEGERAGAEQIHHGITPWRSAHMVDYSDEGMIYLFQAPAIARFLSEWQLGTPDVINLHLSGDHWRLGVKEGFRRSGWDLEAWCASSTLEAGVWFLATEPTPYPPQE